MSRRLVALLSAVALSTLVALPPGGAAMASTPTTAAKSTPTTAAKSASKPATENAPAAPPKAVSAPAEAVGAYPTVVAFSNALRTGSYLDTIGVLNGTSHGEYFHFKLSGTVAPWIRLIASEQRTTPITELWVPNGSAPTTALVELQVPRTAPDGTYTGYITVSYPPHKATKKGQTSVGLGAQIGVTVKVTGTEVVAGKLLNAFTFPKIEVGEALPVFAVIKDLGNVSLQPTFHLVVKKASGGNTVYKWHGTASSATLPGQTTTYQLEWPASDTETQTLGKYGADLRVTFPNGKSLGSSGLGFQLYPYGSLHRGGKLLSLKLTNHPALGGTALVQAAVVSTGEVQQETNFVGELYRDGSLVQAVKSPVPVLLAPENQVGDSATITVPFTVAKNGLYRLTGSANFAGAQSNTETLTFRIGAAPIPIVYEIGGAAVVLALIALVVGFIIWRRRSGGPPSWPERRHVTPPRYTAARGGTLHVPPRTPVGSPGTRSQQARPNLTGGDPT